MRTRQAPFSGKFSMTARRPTAAAVFTISSGVTPLSLLHCREKLQRPRMKPRISGRNIFSPFSQVTLRVLHTCPLDGHPLSQQCPEIIKTTRLT